MIHLILDELETILAEIQATLLDLDAELRHAVRMARVRTGRWLYKFGMHLLGREREE